MVSIPVAAVPREDPRELGWEHVHAQICRLAGEKNAYELDEAKWLLAAWKTRVHEPLGFGSFYEYVDRLLGYSRRFVAERLRVARALAELPRLCGAVKRGDISWSAARELSRVATADTVDAWVDCARGETVRDIERAVAGRRPGDRPTDPPDEAVRRHAVRFEVEGDTLALLRAARERVTVEAGGHVDDDRLVRALARALLDQGAGDDPGRAGYQLALHVCAGCGAGKAEGGGELVPVDDAVVESARCDAQEIGRVDGGDVATHVGSTASPRVPAARVSRPSGCRGQSPAAPAAQATRRRATQTIPPALRRQLVRRHQGRCAVPGCRQSGFVHQHHLIRRADGGAHDPETMCLLCEAHHRAVHEGYLAIEGTWSAGLTFRHADGRAYGGRRPGAAGRGGWPSPTRQGRIAAAMRALRGSGRSEQDARRLIQAVVDGVATHVGAGNSRAGNSWSSLGATDSGGTDLSAAELYRLATQASRWVGGAAAPRCSSAPEP